MAVLTWLALPGPTDAWRSLGFEVPGEVVHVGRVAIEVNHPVPEWGFERVQGKQEPLGVPTRQVESPARPTAHPNGVERVDHVVYATRELDEGIALFADVLGLDPRRRARPREAGPEMAFFRAGEAVIEMVEGADEPAIWGVAFRASDLDVTVAALRRAGGEIGDPRESVQGGRIATVPTGWVGFRVAVIERPPKEG